MLTNQIVCSSIILPEIKSRVMWICSLQGPAIERDGIQKKKGGSWVALAMSVLVCVCVTSMRLNCLKGWGEHELTSFCAKIVCALERTYEKTLEIQSMKSTDRFCSALEICIKICHCSKTICIWGKCKPERVLWNEKTKESHFSYSSVLDSSGSKQFCA